MNKEIGNTTKHTLVYAIGNTATKLIGLLLIPIYTNPKYLSLSDFGALAILEATTQILNGLLTFSMASSIQRWYWDKDYIKDQKSIFFTTLVFLFLFNLPIITSLTLSSDFFSNLIFNSPDYSYLLKLVFISVGIKILNNQIMHILKLRERSSFYSSMQIFSLTLSLALIIFFIVVLGKGLNGIWEATLITDIIVLLGLLPFTFHNTKRQFNGKVLKEMINYGLPLMLSSLATIVLSVTDRYMLHFVAGLEQTAIYALGLRFANTLKNVVSNSLNSALAPLRMKKMKTPGNQLFYARLLTYITLVFLLFMLGLSVFTPEILDLVTTTSNFASATYIIPILSLALLFSFMRVNAKIGLVIQKETKKIAALVFVTALLNFGLNYLLIPYFDIFGTAVATLLAQLFYFLSIYRQSQKVYPIPYEVNRLIKAIVLTIILIILGLSLNPINIWIRIVLKIGIISSFPFLLYLIGFYLSEEIEIIKPILSKWKHPKELIKDVKLLFK